jgi:DNA-binding SARP family transcriptional activator
VQFRLVGGLGAIGPDGFEVDLGGPKQRAVLAALLVAERRALTPAALIERVWGDDPPGRVETSLQAYVSNLRRALEPHRNPRAPSSILVSGPSGYALVVDAVDIDVDRADQLIDLAAAADDPTVAHDRLAEAADLAEGPLLPEFGDQWWAVDAVRQHAERRRALGVARVDNLLVLQRHAEAVGLAGNLVADHPYDEQLHGLLALARYRDGRQREALDGIQRARKRLLDDVGIELGPALRQLEQDILLHAESLTPVGYDARTTPSHPVRSTTEPPAEAVGVAHDDVADRPFYGRAHELSVMRAALHRARAVEGQIVVISGEAGAGKTRLVEELLADAVGVPVAWGRCPESAAQAPYWVCTQLIRQIDGAGLAAPGTFVMLTERVAADGSDDPVTGAGRASSRRLGLYRAVSSLLAGIDRPTILVVDDLQWADPASLRLLEYVAGDVWASRALLVVTTRPDDSAHPELADCIAELVRHPNSRRIDLFGLEREDTAEWLRTIGVAEPAGELIDEVQDRTRGNPFFVGQIASLIASGADPSRVPRAVHDAVRRRVARLPLRTQQLLPVSAVIGREFSAAVLASVTGGDPIEVIDDLDPAVSVGVLEQADVPGDYRFVHAIAAEAMAAEIAPGRRAQLHARTAQALEDRGAGAVEEQVAALAHHAYLGMAAGSAELACRWLARAAGQATVELGDDNAVEMWNRLLEALAVSRPDDHGARIDALVARATAYARLDATSEAIGSFLQAMRLALEHRDVARLQQIIERFDFMGLWMAGNIATSGADVVEQVGRAVELLDPQSTAFALARALRSEYGYWVLSSKETQRSSAEAVALARTIGDRTVLARTLVKRVQTTWRSGQLAAAADAVTELEELLGRGEWSPDVVANARLAISAVAWARGDVDRVRRLLKSARLAGTRAVGITTQIEMNESAVNLWTGDLRASAEHLATGVDMYRRTRRWAAEAMSIGFDVPILIEQDRVGEVHHALGVMAEGSRQAGHVFAQLAAFWYTEIGDFDRARTLFGELPEGLYACMEPAANAAALLARTACGELDQVPTLIERLKPVSGQLAANGSSVAYGDVDHALAHGWAALGELESAIDAIDRSVALMRTSRAGPWLVRSLITRARLTNSDADHLEATRVATRLDLPGLRRRLADM